MEKCERCQVLATFSAMPFKHTFRHMYFVCPELYVYTAKTATVWHPQAEISSLQQLLLTKNAEIESLHTQLLARPSLSAESLERGK